MYDRKDMGVYARGRENSEFTFEWRKKVGDPSISQRNLQLDLRNQFHSLFKINSKTGELSLYRTDGEGLDQQEMDKLVHAGDYESVVNQYIDHFVVPEDRERMRKATQQSRWE